jgi:hypothetical protein
MLPESGEGLTVSNRWRSGRANCALLDNMDLFLRKVIHPQAIDNYRAIIWNLLGHL